MMKQQEGARSDYGQLHLTEMHIVIKISTGLWLIATRMGNVLIATNDTKNCDYVNTIKKIREDFAYLTGDKPGLKASKDDVDTFWER